MPSSFLRQVSLLNHAPVKIHVVSSTPRILCLFAVTLMLMAIRLVMLILKTLFILLAGTRAYFKQELFFF